MPVREFVKTGACRRQVIQEHKLSYDITITLIRRAAHTSTILSPKIKVCATQSH